VCQQKILYRLASHNHNQSLTTCVLSAAESLKATAMAKTATTRYDVAEHLRTPEEMAAYLEACMEEANGEAAFIAKTLPGERSPGFDTILKVIGTLGLKLHAEASHT
jgi:DNA-binding phage protein